MTGFTSLAGAGVRGTVDGLDVVVGSPRLLARLALPVPPELAEVVERGEAAACTMVLAGWDGQARAAFAVSDSIKPSSAAAVARLRGLGLRVVLLTGDNAGTAAAVAGQLLIEPGDVFSGVDPGGKVAVISDLQAAGQAGRGGRRRGQRRGRARAGGPRHGRRDRHRRRDRRGRPDPGQRRPADDRGRAAAVPGDAADDPPEPGLGLRVQHRGAPAGRARLPEPALRGPDDGGQLAGRGDERAAAPAIPGGPVTAPPRSDEAGTLPVLATRPALPGDSLVGLLKAALVPLAAAAVITGLLAAWVVTGGAGTLRRADLRVTLAAVPLPFGATAPAPAGTPAPLYLTITNSGGPDELLGATSPLAGGIALVRAGHSAPGGANLLAGLGIPARGSVSLSPFGADLVLLRPGKLTVGEAVPVTLVFRHAGRITVTATVTEPGTH